MNTFLELFEGTFANRRQAQSHPTRYAHIRVVHRRVKDNRFYGEQAYNYLLNRPYRQFVIDVIDEGEFIRLKNYEIVNPSLYVGCQNLENLTDDVLTYREGCDHIMKQTGKYSFEGKNDGCECYVQRGAQKTYVANEVKLSKENYSVLDRGLHVDNHTKVWGSDWGPFNFTRQDASVQS